MHKQYHIVETSASGRMVNEAGRDYSTKCDVIFQLNYYIRIHPPETDEAPLNGLGGCTGEYTLAVNSSNVVASL